MIVFQQTPCRLYPQIINLIKEQFPTSFFVHEVFCFKNNPNNKNPLNVTKNRERKGIMAFLMVKK
jgi:hypothetical protein